MSCIRLLVWWLLLMLSGLTRDSLSLALAIYICNVTDTRNTIQKLLEVWIIWIYVLRLTILTTLTIHVCECKCLWWIRISSSSLTLLVLLLSKSALHKIVVILLRVSRLTMSSRSTMLLMGPPIIWLLLHISILTSRATVLWVVLSYMLLMLSMTWMSWLLRKLLANHIVLCANFIKLISNHTIFYIIMSSIIYDLFIYFLFSIAILVIVAIIIVISIIVFLMLAAQSWTSLVVSHSVKSIMSSCRHLIIITLRIE